MNLFRSLALCAIFITGTDAWAASRAIECDGCSNTKMAKRATQAIEQGTVWVFNAGRERVAKYAVVREVLDTVPYEVWTQTIPLTVEPELQSAWRDYLDARAEAGDGDVIEVPDDFPVRSVAGALHAPTWTTTHLEDYFAELGFARRMELEISTIVGNLIRGNVPFADLQHLIKAIKITVRFPDGSTQEYRIEFSLNAVSGESETELSIHGNPRLEDGSPAPTSEPAFRNFTINDNNGSLAEWILWARHLGLVVSGKGTTMTCYLNDSMIYCRVTKRP